jgi:D-amino-acid oxidase
MNKLEVKLTFYDPKFTVHSGQEGGPGVLRFKSFCLDAPAYLNYLFDKLVNADSLSSSDGRVKVHRSDVSSLLSVQELHPKAKVIINAAGLGAHKLVPNGDASCQLIRGQTLIVQLPIGVEPKIFTGVNSFSSTVAKQAGQDVAHQLSYIIPRARSGMVILGGTYEPGRLVMEEDVNQSARILKDSAKLWPDLIPPLQATVENDSQKEGWERIKVLKVNVGFRPGRSAGPRVELVQVPGAIALLHVYGLGGAGYQRGVGVASAVDEQLDIVMETQRGHT